eukprot:1408847-Prymnesium_polylepis.1
MCAALPAWGRDGGGCPGTRPRLSAQAADEGEGELGGDDGGEEVAEGVVERAVARANVERHRQRLPAARP